MEQYMITQERLAAKEMKALEKVKRANALMYSINLRIIPIRRIRRVFMGARR